VDITIVAIFFCVIIGFFLLMQWTNRRKVKNNHICLIVTRSRDLLIVFAPKVSEGNVEAPPNKLYISNDKIKRTYMYNRRFSLNVKYPFMATGFMALTQIDASASIYEEGDSRPILPSDEEAISTPKRITAMAAQNIIPQVIQGLRENASGQPVGAGLNLGKNKLLVMIVVVAIVLLIVANTFFGYSIYQTVNTFVNYAYQWFSVH
jgi:hypothetical protein